MNRHIKNNHNDDEDDSSIDGDDTLSNSSAGEEDASSLDGSIETEADSDSDEDDDDNDDNDVKYEVDKKEKEWLEEYLLLQKTVLGIFRQVYEDEIKEYEQHLSGHLTNAPELKWILLRNIMSTWVRERYIEAWCDTKTYPRKGIVYKAMKTVISESSHKHILSAAWAHNYIFEAIANIWLRDVFAEDDED